MILAIFWHTIWAIDLKSPFIDDQHFFIMRDLKTILHGWEDLCYRSHI